MVVEIDDGLPVLRPPPREVQQMKSYWIAAAVLLLTAWPGSRTYALDQQQVTEGKPVQQAQASNPSASLQRSVAVPVAAKPLAATAEAGAAPATTVKPKDSYMLVELSKGLKARKLKVGDKVHAEVSQDVVAHGKVIIPVETKLVGHVTEVSARGSGRPESRLGIVFDRILLKHYHDIDFKAVVQAVAPPVQRRSRVDEPSQMLPPSMIGGGLRDTTTAPGRSNSSGNRSQPSAGASAGMSTAASIPLTVKVSPTTHAASGTSAALLDTGPGGKPLSVGMPQGVVGLKGLSLSSEASPNTPGPVIVSNTENVKLDSGTQILLHVLKVEVPANEKPAK